MNAPQKGQRGTYHKFIGGGEISSTPVDEFLVHRVEGSLCYAIYDKDPTGTPSPFIWRFAGGRNLNRLHFWPGKEA